MVSLIADISIVRFKNKDMSIHLSFKCFFLAIGALLAQEMDYCFDKYCYRSDRKLINITSLKEAQDYCYNYDNTSWLLEIYDMNMYNELYNQYNDMTLLLNTIGTVSSEWTSITNGELPSKMMFINQFKLIFADYLQFFHVNVLKHK